MGRKSFAVNLPAEVKAWLDQELIKRGFQDYEQLAASLRDQGVETSTSAVHRYGQQLEKQLEAIKASTEAAKAIAAAAPDEADAHSAAVIRLFQSNMFDAMLELRDAEAETDPGSRMLLLGKSARGLAALTRASLNQKKWAQEVNAKLNAAKDEAAKQAETIAKRAGMSDDDFAKIRAKILGIEVQV